MSKIIFYGSYINKYLAEEDINGAVTDIASSKINSPLYNNAYVFIWNDWIIAEYVNINDSILYSYWPVKTHRYFELLENKND
jgi:hypothetical protein